MKSGYTPNIGVFQHLRDERAPTNAILRSIISLIGFETQGLGWWWWWWLISGGGGSGVGGGSGGGGEVGKFWVKFVSRVRF